MKRLMGGRFGVGVLVAIAVAAFQAAGVERREAGASHTIVYLVRHAEKEGRVSGQPDEDIELNDEGKRRAEALRMMLRDVTVDAIYATQYKRTRDTVAAIGEASGVEVTVTGADDRSGLISAIRDPGMAGKTILVSGHSNTVPAILAGLGEPLDSANLAEDEYDGLFVLFISRGADGAIVDTTLHRVRYSGVWG